MPITPTVMVHLKVSQDVMDALHERYGVENDNAACRMAVMEALGMPPQAIAAVGPKRRYHLSKEELYEIDRLIEEGRSNQEIAQHIGGYTVYKTISDVVAQRRSRKRKAARQAAGDVAPGEGATRYGDSEAGRE